MSTRVTDRDRGMRRIARAFARLPNLDLTVGYHAGKKRDDGTPHAHIAAIHEYGAARANVPPRPTLGPTADRKADAYRRRLGGLARRVISGTLTPQGALDVLGGEIQGDVKRAITKLRSPRLKPATVAAKRSSNPLIDTGAMRDAVEHRVRGRGLARLLVR